MIFSALISSLILIESREIGQSMLSQPFMVSFLLVFLGFDPYFVFITAALTHFFYIHYVPSGATKYPEYPFSFFVVISSTKEIIAQFEPNIGLLTLITFALIIIVSRLTATYVYYKRMYIEKFIEKFITDEKKLGIRLSLGIRITYSIVTFTTFALILIYLSKNLLFKFLAPSELSLAMNDLIIFILLGMFTPYLFSKKKFKASFTGIIIGLIILLV
ncbi:MAG: hypothetical protein JXR69_01260 [Candidatus Delongbacteria bacterium]|nr:hypothetical protein [Candidatus Delongbacteria bacterium]